MNMNKDVISDYIENREAIANTYMRSCFTVIIGVYTVAISLNLLDVFIVDQTLMASGYIPSVAIFLITMILTKLISPSHRAVKYIHLLGVIMIFTIAGVTITYHAVLVSMLPFLYAMLYASKKVMYFVFGATVISTFVVVYGGYYFGLCDANMVLLTTGPLQQHVADGMFINPEANSDPKTTLFLYFVLPRCLIYIAFMTVCRSIYSIVNGTLEKAKLTSELEKAKSEAENANREKSRFLARISHEIRTPINAIIGMNEMIIRESGEENVIDYANDVKKSSVMLLGIVNEILDSTKIESGMMEVVEVEYEMADVLSYLYNLIKIRAEEKQLKLIFDIDPSIPSKYFGDDKHIKQILTNLLTNAVKYTPSGTVTLSLRCTWLDGDAQLYFSVKDTGVGIKEEDIGKIYDAFKRIDLKRNRHVEGTGLGMTIVQQLLNIMGSKLEIKSVYEQGSEFSFMLCQKIISEDVIGDFRKKSDNRAAEKSEGSYYAPDAKILVVDDNALNIKVFKKLLIRSGIQITETLSGSSCLEILRREAFDIVFLDHMMPGMDGIETLAYIKEERLCEGVPVIMLTANAISGDREMYISKGFDDFISKPIMPDILDNMILKYLPAGKFSTASEEKEDKSVAKSGKSVMEKIKEGLREFNFSSALMICGEDEDFYIELLGDFTALPIIEELTDCVADGDNVNYSILVHGFKNNAYSVGAQEIGDIAFELEKLTKEGFSDEVRILQGKLFREYERVCGIYEDCIQGDLV